MICSSINKKVQFACTLILTILILCSIMVNAQEFDRIAAKNIKTEINLNRIARSREPLDQAGYNQKRADSLNWLYYQKYKKVLFKPLAR